jgi:hypothetical protein
MGLMHMEEIRQERLANPLARNIAKMALEFVHPPDCAHCTIAKNIRAGLVEAVGSGKLTVGNAVDTYGSVFNKARCAKPVPDENWNGSDCMPSTMCGQKKIEDDSLEDIIVNYSM